MPATPTLSDRLASPGFGAERRIVIHPGPPKTGTTAIQKSFRKSQDALRPRGILYPSFAENHGRPLRLVLQPGLGFEAPPGGPTREDYVRQVRGAVEDELKAPDWQCCVFSGEDLVHLPSDGWRDLNLWLAPFADRIEVIFAIREPVEMARSMIQQMLKSGRLLEDLYRKLPQPAYRYWLETIQSAFPAEAIRLWDFDAASKAPHGLVFDFAQAIGLDAWSARHVSGQRTETNPSLSQPAVDRLAERNRQTIPPAPVTREELLALREMGGPKFRLPQALADRIAEENVPDFDWLEETFGFVPAWKARAGAAEC